MALRLPEPVAAGLRQGVLIGTAALALVLPLQHAPRQAAAPTRAAPAALAARVADFGATPRSAEAQQLAQWIAATADNGERDFAIVDKRHARVYVFDAGARLQGATPVLLGYAQGDETVPGIGHRPIEAVQPHERTTPAGRFIARPGVNALQEDVLWVDYDAAVSMHRVRTTHPQERRLERLASATESDNRISYGCINMPVAFFEQVLWPRFGQRGGIVYVLPEVRALHDVFPALRGGPAAALTSSA